MYQVFAVPKLMSSVRSTRLTTLIIYLGRRGSPPCITCSLALEHAGFAGAPPQRRGYSETAASLADRCLPLAQPIEASLAKPDLYAPTSVSISASVIGVANVHVPELMIMQPSL